MHAALGADDGRELVLFVHGLWLHASSWQEWAGEFGRAGYDCGNFRWPGEPATAAAWRDAPATAEASIGGLQRELASLVRACHRRPIVIGHGTGGLLAEILLGQALARAAISIAPLPTGITAARSALRLARMPQSMSWLAAGRTVTPTPAQFRQVIANATAGDEAAELYRRYVTPGRPRPLAWSLLTTRRDRRTASPDSGRRGPLLLISAAQDQLTCEASISALHRRYRRQHPAAVTDYQVFPGQGHSLTIDGQWRSVAFYCLDWLTRQDL